MHVNLHCLRFLEFAHLLNVIHEITTVHVLHHKIQTVLEREEEDEKENSDRTQFRPHLCFFQHAHDYTVYYGRK